MEVSALSYPSSSNSGPFANGHPTSSTESRRSNGCRSQAEHITISCVGLGTYLFTAWPEATLSKYSAVACLVTCASCRHLAWASERPMAAKFSVNVGDRRWASFTTTLLADS